MRITGGRARRRRSTTCGPPPFPRGARGRAGPPPRPTPPPPPLASASALPAVERNGGAGTVAAVGATYRQITDFANLDGSAATNTPGQSGQPGSPFYDNLREAWANGEYFPLLYTRAAVEANAAHRLTLQPGGR